MKRVITISREYGAGGHSIGRKVSSFLPSPAVQAISMIPRRRSMRSRAQSLPSWPTKAPVSFWADARM